MLQNAGRLASACEYSSTTPADLQEVSEHWG